jgi:hypothetical protein
MTSMMKMPLISSGNTVIKILGYIIYALVLLVILGLVLLVILVFVLPSPPDYINAETVNVLRSYGVS